MFPAAGIVPDFINTEIYALRGDKTNYYISLAAMVPIIGLGATAAKLAKKADNIIEVATDIGKIEVKETSKAIESGADVLESLSRAQKRNVETLNNIIENNLKDHDFSGTLRDLQGNPVPKPNGGFWDHKTEMIQSYKALTDIKNGLEGSLKNPNLSPEVSKFLKGELNKADTYIQKIENLFAPYGGVK